MSSPTRQQRIDATVSAYAERLAQLREDAELQHALFLEPDALRQAVEEATSKRRPYGLLRNPPTFRERPLGSLLLRVWRWHRGNGQLDSRILAQWDARWLANNLGRYPAYDHLGLQLEGHHLFETVDHAALILANGSSPAADAWRRAIGTVPA